MNSITIFILLFLIIFLYSNKNSSYEKFQTTTSSSGNMVLLDSGVLYQNFNDTSTNPNWQTNRYDGSQSKVYWQFKCDLSQSNTTDNSIMGIDNAKCDITIPYNRNLNGVKPDMVLLSITRLDAGTVDSNLRYDLYVNWIGDTSFGISIKKWSYSWISNMVINWYAIKIMP
jgi:hypothetical protein